ncbi:hypothetical protein [Metabacillus fastidiosus]|uniref:hypothetical protein n=1 Tax=Metabacillus fastidiosus TaxID=1458 RepID=UPI000824C585|nr:hypothetical protein [Metabacillus fastidiosus]MED4463794.1 hypothetical protein [Metabacillus fastidiosus]
MGSSSIHVFAIFASDDEEKIDYKVTQQRYDKAGTLYMAIEADVTEKEQAKELTKQVEAKHKDKQTGLENTNEWVETSN